MAATKGEPSGGSKKKPMKKPVAKKATRSWGTAKPAKRSYGAGKKR